MPNSKYGKMTGPEFFSHQAHIYELRTQLLAKFDRKCQRCSASLNMATGVVHHRHYRTFGHETLDDVALLCDACHTAIHELSMSNSLTVKDADLVDPEWRESLLPKTETDAPKCSKCGAVMTYRTPKPNGKQFSPFWSCSRFPKCNQTINTEFWTLPVSKDI